MNQAIVFNLNKLFMLLNRKMHLHATKRSLISPICSTYWTMIAVTQLRYTTRWQLHAHSETLVTTFYLFLSSDNVGSLVDVHNESYVYQLISCSSIQFFFPAIYKSLPPRHTSAGCMLPPAARMSGMITHVYQRPRSLYIGNWSYAIAGTMLGQQPRPWPNVDPQLR